MDMSKLTLGEIAQIEDISGLPVSALADDDKPKAKSLIALAYVMTKRTNPQFTINEAEALTMEDLQAFMAGGDDTPEAPSA